ncbi:putative T7SS-secreted protein [Streptomyces goshikiensis]|uniref:putative T7SS-secreted protein n=1 Tax=Streptomyces goshikiensis TaxID=1942 RepID=UPI00369AF871
MTDWGDLANRGLDKVEHGLDRAKKVVGSGVDRATDRVGGVLEGLGAHDWADKVEDFGDGLASRLGAEIREQRLGQSDQANELVHGSPSAIRESAKHFADFHTAFDRVGQGMKALDSGHWKGAAADAFRQKFAMHPGDWMRAADACATAGKVLISYADTVEWAQQQAAAAITLYQQGEQASKEADETHEARSAAFKANVAAGRDAGPEPVKGADPGDGPRARAEEVLNEARHQRDEAARATQRVISAALEHAPATPPPLDRAVGTFLDAQQAGSLEVTHVLGGAVKGTAGMLNFARGLNPSDPYNLTHPAEYSQNVNTTLAGLVSTASHPERIPSAFIDSFKDDFSEGAGRLLPELIGTKGMGATRLGTRVAAAEGKAARTGLSESMATRKDWRDWTSPKSTKPVAPEIPPDSYLSTGDPVYYRHGSTAIGYDSSTLVNFDLVKPKPGYHDVVIHGNNEGFFEPGRVNAAGKGFSAGDTSPAHIAEAIRNNPGYTGGPVRLVSCHTGTIGPGVTEIPAAQNIANQLGTPVLAPTNKVGVGRDLGPGQTPEIFGGGYWRLFLPITS